MRLTPAQYRAASKRLAEQSVSLQTDTAAKPSISYTSHLIVDEAPEGFHLIYPLNLGNPEYKAQLEYFKRQLEKVDTVDEAIEEIDSGFHREKRDG
jgi:hypothetical protein